MGIQWFWAQISHKLLVSDNWDFFIQTPRPRNPLNEKLERDLRGPYYCRIPKYLGLLSALPTFVGAKTGQKIWKGGPNDIFDGLFWQ